MKSRDINRLLKKNVAPSLPEWTLRGDLLYSCPVEMYLFGFAFSGDTVIPGCCRLWEFGMPLYIRPVPYIYFTWGELLAHGNRDTYFEIGKPDADAVFAEVVEIIRRRTSSLRARFESPEGFLRSLDTPIRFVNPFMRLEAEAYTIALIGPKRRACSALDELVSEIEANVDDSIDATSPEALDQAKALRSLAKSSHDSLVEHLSDTRIASLQAIKIPTS
ncbi:MAG TPA: hypothetical protein P5081_05950 [Phycisphaerae bacterium]|nr:hypothetical protein [Phycisphaerae bacterium]HRW52410.1 hypothetical protein [Phycisphaerae bacterium]